VAIDFLVRKRLDTHFPEPPVKALEPILERGLRNIKIWRLTANQSVYLTIWSVYVLILRVSGTTIGIREKTDVPKAKDKRAAGAPSGESRKRFGGGRQPRDEITLGRR
jgi:hypothetical protein